MEKYVEEYVYTIKMCDIDIDTLLGNNGLLTGEIMSWKYSRRYGLMYLHLKQVQQ